MKLEESKKDQEEERAVKIDKIKRAIYIHDKLIDRYPEIYKNLKKEFEDEKQR